MPALLLLVLASVHVGLWFHARPGHLAPSGAAAAGAGIAGVAEGGAGPVTGPVLGLESAAMARQVRDGNVTIATVVVAHRDLPDAAAFLVDVVARWCTDRLRMQLSASELAEEIEDYRSEGLVPVMGELVELRDAMSLVWRMLLLWLALLALLVIAGWVS